MKNGQVDLSSGMLSSDNSIVLLQPVVGSPPVHPDKICLKRLQEVDCSECLSSLSCVTNDATSVGKSSSKSFSRTSWKDRWGGGANDPKTRTRQMNESFYSRPCVWINDRVHLPTESSADVSATQSEQRTGKSPGTSIPLHVNPDTNGNLWSC
ncbi:unnamed protein product [Pleuronectes platessa]|uniref:Uncharacterized protein n=1 Tax=Pleuronectes platessa TaxID=8262 RepID=A0A9N7UZ27_PLEPL|nr:unnamed protein product [Pleuronectes platessa]